VVVVVLGVLVEEGVVEDCDVVIALVAIEEVAIAADIVGKTELVDAEKAVLCTFDVAIVDSTAD
jgi:hypothetical protein